MSTFQQIVMVGGKKPFAEEVNALLMDGWKVVPGTFAIAIIEQVSRPDFPHACVTPRGTVMLQQHFIVLERTETSEGASV
jgi:hypothetical protein